MASRIIGLFLHLNEINVETEGSSRGRLKFESECGTEFAVILH